MRRDSYCLDGGYHNETLCLEKSDGVWRVYYCERGQRSPFGSYPTEEEACGEVLRRLLDDPTTRIYYVPPVIPPHWRQDA